MYCITEQQIDFILSDIRRRGVEMEDLQHNLLDHICCLVEQNLGEGEDFEAFYQKTIPKFFKRALWEIEEETITLLTFKHYYAMKKAMIISGTISVAAFLTGSFFKIMYWPGANVMLFLGIVTFVLLFLPFLFIVKSREQNRWQEKMLIGLFILAGMLYITSSLFAVMHWPYRTPLWISTSAFSLFVLTPFYFFTNIRKEGSKINTAATTIILVVATGILFTSTTIRPSKPVELCNFFSNQDLAGTAQFLSTQNNQYFEKKEDGPAAEQKKLTDLHAMSNSLYNKIEKLKLEMINQIEGTNYTSIDYSKIFSSKLVGHVQSTKILFGGEEKAGPVLSDIKKNIEDFDSYIKTNFGIESFSIIKTTPFTDYTSGAEVPWEEFNFYKVPFDMVIRNLTQIQVDIRSAEAVCIRS